MKWSEKLSDAVDSGESHTEIKQNILEALNGFTHCPFCGSMLDFHERYEDELYGCTDCDFSLCSKQNYQRYIAEGVDTSDEFVRDQTNLGGGDF